MFSVVQRMNYYVCFFLCCLWLLSGVVHFCSLLCIMCSFVQYLLVQCHLCCAVFYNVFSSVFFSVSVSWHIVQCYEVLFSIFYRCSLLCIVFSFVQTLIVSFGVMQCFLLLYFFAVLFSAMTFCSV